MPRTIGHLPTKKSPIIIHNGDCREYMVKYDAQSIDSIVTDPPYGLAFMGKEWDSFGGKSNPNAEIDRDEASGRGGKSIQPFGYSGSAIWDANQQRAFYQFTLEWCHLAYRLLKPGHYALIFGGTRTFHRLTCAVEDAGFEICDVLAWMYGQGFPKGKSCLKPAWEPIILACKPGKKAVPLQIDRCRLEGIVPETKQGISRGTPTGQAIYGGGNGFRKEAKEFIPHDAGRWPPNVCMDEEAAAILDEQSGDSRSISSYRGDGIGNGYGKSDAEFNTLRGHNDLGGASRFMYIAKASTADRNLGLRDGDTNKHPTVKPINLIRWLVRLITPERGLVLDPFLGSGTTALAALDEKCMCIGIEQDEESIITARARIKGVSGLIV